MLSYTDTLTHRVAWIPWHLISSCVVGRSCWLCSSICLCAHEEQIVVVTSKQQLHRYSAFAVCSPTNRLIDRDRINWPLSSRVSSAPVAVWLIFCGSKALFKLKESLRWLNAYVKVLSVYFKDRVSSLMDFFFNHSWQVTYERPRCLHVSLCKFNTTMIILM